MLCGMTQPVTNSKDLTMSSLTNEKCLPCETGVGAMSAESIAVMLPTVPKWELSANGKAIVRHVKFKNFVESLAAINRIGAIAEDEGHHPDIAFGWGYADITLTTHATDSLTRNDFIVAAKIDAALV
jgi:4a-hydroxytetrahydrobiopterin dehydratase